MNRSSAAWILPIALLALALPALAGCGNKANDPPPQPVILEPGLTENDNAAAEPAAPAPAPASEVTAPAEDGFTDLGRASTLDDLMANKALIKSYYFEQTIRTVAGDIFIKTWYKDGQMKLVSSLPDSPVNIEYYDSRANTIITHMPASGNDAWRMAFAAGDPDLPDNPLAKDYHDFKVLDTDSVNGQLCRVLESKLGEKIWVSTRHGFPMQVEFNDPTNDEHIMVLYENLALNQVRDEEIAVPDSLIIHDMGGGWAMPGGNAEEPILDLGLPEMPGQEMPGQEMPGQELPEPEELPEPAEAEPLS